MTWTIMPYLGNLEQTEAAVIDVLNQSAPVQLLLINQGGPRLTTVDDPRVFHWHHDPPLPSLSATWNRALQMVWETGGEYAWVVNNDTRFHPGTYSTLVRTVQETDAWFVSAVGVTEEQFAAFRQQETEGWGIQDRSAHRGGPDFSCFVITRACHEAYPFDEGCQPGYLEDLDMHRRLMLDGHRDKIFSVNLPFLHYASGTLKAMTPEKRERWERRISEGSRAHYRAKWGGDCNQERYTRPFDPTSEQVGVTTPELQHGQTTR